MDLGRSGAYNDVADNTRTFTNDRSYNQQRDTSPYGERFSNEIEMNKRESGVYSRFIGSFKQSLNDHHQGSASMSIGKSIKHDDEQIFETEQKTPDSGTYSRNIGSYGDRTTNTDGQSYNNGTIENHDFTRGSKYEQRIHENGIHKTQVGSIRDIDDTDGRMKTYQQRNYEYESQPRSNTFFQPLKYVGNTLDTPFEQDEDSPAKSVDSFRQSNPTQSYISKSKNNGTATSTSDHDGNGVPHWAKMMYDTGFTDEYLKQKWPRVSY